MIATGYAQTTPAQKEESRDQSTQSSLETKGQLGNAGASQISAEQMHLVKKAKMIRVHDEFKSFLYIYPKSLRYETQKIFSRARNILIKTEFREKDSSSEDATPLKVKTYFHLIFFQINSLILITIF